MMSETEQAILDALRNLPRTFKRVVSWQVAMEIEKSERTARNYLNKLEAAGLVCRPNGKNSGWVLVVA